MRGSLERVPASFGSGEPALHRNRIRKQMMRNFSSVEASSLPGDEPGTGIRVRRLCSDGQVILEQMRHSLSAGWYVQKSFSVPAELLDGVILELRKAQCLSPRKPRAKAPPLSRLRLCRD
jgi:hypothetical protein